MSQNTLIRKAEIKENIAYFLAQETDSLLDIPHKNVGVPKAIQFERKYLVQKTKRKKFEKISDVFEEKNFSVTETTFKIIKNVNPFSGQREEFSLFGCISVKDLLGRNTSGNFEKWATYLQIIHAAVGFMVKVEGENHLVAFCTTQDAVDFREQYPDQPEGEMMHVAMDPVYDYAGNPRIFSLGNLSKGLVLYATDGSLKKVFLDTDLFIFKLMKAENCF